MDDGGQEAENDIILDIILAVKGFYIDQASLQPKRQKRRANIWFGIKEDE
jgi:hypothetical protein